MTYAVSLDDKVLITERGASNDSVNKAPIIDIDNSEKVSYNKELFKPWFFYDKTTLVLPINYYLYKAGVHKFTLVYYPSENNSTNKTLKLYLRHYNADDKSHFIYFFAKIRTFLPFFIMHMICVMSSPDMQWLWEVLNIHLQ